MGDVVQQTKPVDAAEGALLERPFLFACLSEFFTDRTLETQGGGDGRRVSAKFFSQRSAAISVYADEVLMLRRECRERGCRNVRDAGPDVRLEELCGLALG